MRKQTVPRPLSQAKPIALFIGSDWMRCPVRLAGWIGQRRSPRDLGTPDEIASTPMAALKGINSSSKSLPEHHAVQTRLAAVFGYALVI